MGALEVFAATELTTYEWLKNEFPELEEFRKVILIVLKRG